jgi:hypothetical protein
MKEIITLDVEVLGIWSIFYGAWIFYHAIWFSFPNL